jgi:serine/threonine protein kinase
MPPKKYKVKLAPSSPPQSPLPQPVARFVATLLPNNPSLAMAVGATLVRDFGLNGNFPFRLSQFVAHCAQCGHRLPPIAIQLFDEAYSHLAPCVAGGKHVVYEKNQPTPYKIVPDPRFPRRGAFGEVCKVHDAERGDTLARKQIYEKDQDTITKMKAEVSLMSNIFHPHILQVLGSYEQQKIHYVLLKPFAEYTLDDVIRDESPFPKTFDFLTNWILDLVAALGYLHDKGIRHGDLKPDNILITGGSDARIMIADFGLSREAGSDKAATEPGSHVWGGPEADGGAIITRKADVFAMGTVLVEILAFGNGINTDALHALFSLYGPKKCQATQHQCFAHNMPVVMYVLGHLSRERGMGKVMDVVFFDMLAIKPTLRPSSAEIAKSISTAFRQLPEFKKGDCCDWASVEKYQGSTMKELLKEFEGMKLESEKEKFVKEPPKGRNLKHQFALLLEVGKGSAVF